MWPAVGRSCPDFCTKIDYKLELGAEINPPPLHCFLSGYFIAATKKKKIKKKRS
ncbi:mCG142580 [Mus musculus]|nr:mCG142580 [Mus musculus]